ncbi:hypothetical protein HDU93_002290 [Gonapodya sp. JEL0774]|nr:hypothetical protein HDU93_002290 [Gonapodya sp. JEL0774]
MLSMIFDCIEVALNEPSATRKISQQNKEERKTDGKSGGALRDDMEPPFKAAQPDESADGEVDLIKVISHLLMDLPCLADLLDDLNKDLSDKTIYFTFDDHTLLSVTEIDGDTPIDTRTRIVLRDVTGKFTWDSWIFYDSLDKIQELLDNQRTRRRIRTAFDRDFTISDGAENLGTIDEFILSEETFIEKQPLKLSP